MTTGIHRLVEEHAAHHGHIPAIAGTAEALTYRDLNTRANVVARELCARGFRRDGHAVVVCERSVALATILLGVLKAGGRYTWLDPDRHDGSPRGVSISVGRPALEHIYQRIPIERLLRAGEGRSCANLPVVTRDSDIAVVIASGSSPVLVPHGTIITLATSVHADTVTWKSEPDALDLWVGLMNGVTVTVSEHPHVAAAA